MEIAGNVALVTGAASGLGEATARRLHAAGAEVVLADVNEAGAGRLRPTSATRTASCAATSPPKQT